jgi:hypothetical protein
MNRRTVTFAYAAGVATAIGLQAWGPARFARMSGSSIAAADAAPWTTDFLNAAYFRRELEEREVDDLRLAFAILTTRWHRNGHRRLRATDAPAFHRVFGRDRFLDGSRSARGTLNREQLLEGAARLHGPWFPDAYADDARRAWGIAFEDADDRASYRPEARQLAGRLGPLTPGTAPPEQQTWNTYPPVEVPSADGVVAALSKPETWPDYASEIGRFTPVRAGGLAGQTFEIEVAAGTQRGVPVYVRGYVTITRIVSREDPEPLADYVRELNEGLAHYGEDEPPAVPEGADAVLAFDLTTHEGHFMGSGNNRLVLFEQDGKAFERAAGTWDPMPWHLQQAYERAGREAQHAFWGQGAITRQSMLHQIAARLGQPAPA